MAICRPRTIGDAPARGPERSGGHRCGDFLVSRGMGEAQGKKVATTVLRLRRSRRSRSSARSSHQRGHVRCVRTATSGEGVAYLGSAEQEVATIRRRKRSNLLQTAVSSPKRQSRHRRSAGGLVGPAEMGRLVKAPRGTAPPRSGPDHPSFNASIYASLLDEEGDERSSLARSGWKNWVRRIRREPSQFERARLCKSSQACPRCAPNTDRAKAS